MPIFVFSLIPDTDVYLQTRYGDGTIAELNAALDDKEWDEKLFKELTGRKIGKLWGLYCDEVEGGGRASLGIHAGQRVDVERRDSIRDEEDSGWEVVKDE